MAFCRTLGRGFFVGIIDVTSCVRRSCRGGLLLQKRQREKLDFEIDAGGGSMIHYSHDKKADGGFANGACFFG